MKQHQPKGVIDLPHHKAGIVLSVHLPLLTDYMSLYGLQPATSNPAPIFMPDLILIVKGTSNDLNPAQHHLEITQDPH